MTNLRGLLYYLIWMMVLDVVYLEIHTTAVPARIMRNFKS
jgi:hypothetical protein